MGYHPFVGLSWPLRWSLLVALSIAAGVVGSMLARQARPMKASVPDAVLAYEFAWCAEHVEQLKSALGEHVATMRRQLLLDYVFLLLYPIALSLGCAMLADSRHNSMAAVGAFLAWVVLASGLLDAVENGALYTMLGRPATDGLAMLASVCAGLKFALVYAAMGYIALQGLAVALSSRSG